MEKAPRIRKNRAEAVRNEEPGVTSPHLEKNQQGENRQVGPGRMAVMSLVTEQRLNLRSQGGGRCFGRQTRGLSPSVER